ncbi:MAG: hypothetical protein JXX14_01550 [Deltaproteobacteria bacterium]|nr:hypothetical protein [Deltaproteobacteria bacterium]
MRFMAYLILSTLFVLAGCTDDTTENSETIPDHRSTDSIDSNQDDDTGPAITDSDDSDSEAPNDRPALLDVIPNYFGFGYSSFSAVRSWPPQVKKTHGINWNYLYWYQLTSADETVLPARLDEAVENHVMPVLTHYQLLDRGRNAGYDGNTEWDIVIQAVQDNSLMRDYFGNVTGLMKAAAAHGTPMIFQTEPDSTTWLRQYHTDDTWDARNGNVAVASTGHQDLADLPNTIAGYAQALVRLRDLYAPKNVYMGLCEFDNENGWNPDRSVAFIKSLGAKFDVLFTHHIIKYSTKDEGWWDAFSETDQERFLLWIRTITQATGLKYIHWQTVIGAEDYGLMPDYPTEERISQLVDAGSIGNLYDLYSLDGPPHSQPWHGFSSSPPADHPAYNSLDKLAERLSAYYASPIPLR